MQHSVFKCNVDVLVIVVVGVIHNVMWSNVIEVVEVVVVAWWNVV